MQAKNQLTRRQLRIKIFQLLFSKELQTEDLSQARVQDLRANIKQTEAALTAIFLFVTRIFDYTLNYANQRASKLIQTADDIIDTDLARVSFIKQVQENPSFVESVKQNNLTHMFPTEIIKKCFFLLKETDEYKAFYLNKDNKVAIEHLVLRAAEYALNEEGAAYNFFDEKFISWEDDLELLCKWVSLTVKQPSKIDFSNTLDSERAQFADELIESYYEKEEYLFSLIKPKLNNWESERVAMIDLLLLKLGLAELLFFPSIPVKVSINEYIDIAKMYSTDQSGQFVNGVLDNIRKELEAQGELRKFDNVKTNK